jgi:hypothetical protein
MTGFGVTEAEISVSATRVLLVFVLFYAQKKTVLALGFENISDAKMFLLTNQCVGCFQSFSS